MENNSQENLGPWVQERLANLGSDGEWEPNVARGLATLRAHRGASVRRRTSLWTLAMAGIACFFVMALPQPRVLAHRCVECSIALWQGLSNSRDVRAANLIPQEERKAPAAFRLDDASGKPVQLSDFKGEVVLLNFWATWCGGCQAEIPWFIEFESKYQSRGLTVVGISMDEDGWKSVTPYVRAKKVNYPMVIGNEAVGKFYGLGNMPMTLMIDRAGRVAATHVGLVSRTDYASEIEALLKEKTGGL